MELCILVVSFLIFFSVRELVNKVDGIEEKINKIESSIDMMNQPDEQKDDSHSIEMEFKDGRKEHINVDA